MAPRGPTRRWTPAEVALIKGEYAADPLVGWRHVADLFQARFGGKYLRSNQVRYVRLRYVYPNGQADNPKYANRHRGPRKTTA
ncbi:hypothetical protein IMZ48_08775 [Candidatus Bathyarchaeota archaeon]|nr:hypothetical protein [Candidatus Bathyarchaeota archaeon]